jgi:hypothetical protein
LLVSVSFAYDTSIAYAAKAVDINGNPVPNASIRLYSNGWFYICQTDAWGYSSSLFWSGVQVQAYIVDVETGVTVYSNVGVIAQQTCILTLPINTTYIAPPRQIIVPPTTASPNQTSAPTPAPTPIITPTPTPIITPVPTPTITPVPTPTTTPTPLPTSTSTPSPTPTPTPTPTTPPHHHHWFFWWW